MEITFDDFVAVCPSAMSPDSAVFDSVKAMFESRMFLIKGIVTDEIFSRLENAGDDVQDPDYERLVRLRKAVVGYVCASAYYLVIPQLDLVLTPTGFGVVSNQNVAPASADRVQRLRGQIHFQEHLYMDEIIDLLRTVVNWGKSTHGGYFFNTLFWKGEHVRQFGVASPTRDDLVERWPDIDGAARDLQLALSPELYKALLGAEATASATPMQSALITMWRSATVAWCRHDGSWRRNLQAMLLFVEENVDDFPEYRDSPTYIANHSQRYENKKDDPCFFFG